MSKIELSYFDFRDMHMGQQFVCVPVVLKAPEHRNVIVSRSKAKKS